MRDCVLDSEEEDDNAFNRRKRAFGGSKQARIDETDAKLMDFLRHHTACLVNYSPP